MPRMRQEGPCRLNELGLGLGAVLLDGSGLEAVGFD